MSQIFNHGTFMAELRKRRGTVPGDWYRDIMAALEVGLGQSAPPAAGAAPAATGTEPAWVAEARKHMGKAEIPGARHSPFVTSLWKVLGRPYTDDETPWCGGFVGYCLKQAGIKGPAVPERAKAWADWGKATPPRIGAVAVFGRQGGGHVGFAMGESAGYIYVLGGNQGNRVSIAPIAKDRLIAMRWPGNLALSDQILPRMTGGAVSRNEA